MNKDIKNISIPIHKEALKKFKKMAVDKEIPVYLLIREILEKIASSKKYETEVTSET